MTDDTNLDLNVMTHHPLDCYCIRCLLTHILDVSCLILHSTEAILATYYPTSGVINQGEPMLTGTIKGLVPGGADQFFCTPVDVNGNADQLPAGSPPPTFTASDPGVVIGPPSVADPTGNSCTVTAPTTATPGQSFTLTWTATITPSGGAPTTITAIGTVPYLTPPQLNPVGGVLSQGAPAK